MINYDIHPDYLDMHQSFVNAKHGMVATGSVPAAQAGLKILQEGGNAVDAAIATAAALTVVEPTTNGLGGETYVIAWINDQLIGLNASGFSPKNLTVESFKEKHGDIASIPLYDWTPVLVPGSIKGWEALSKRYGKLSLAQCLAPAIALAQDGFVISPILARTWQKAYSRYQAIGKDDPKFNAWFDTFSFSNQAPQTNDIIKLPDHAKTLQLIADQGSDVFYRGQLAQQLVDASNTHGGFFQLEDLLSYDVTWVDPILMDYHGYQVAELPPNGQGILASMALNTLKHLPTQKKKNTQFYHQQIEAMKLAFADGLEHIGDPRYMRININDFLTKEHGLLQAQKITNQAQTFTPYKPYASGTIYLATADQQGNMVSLIQSNYTGFGSGMVVPNTGIALNNRGGCFTLDQNHVNGLGPSKMAYNTIIPGFLLKENQPVGPFAIMGGFMQPQGHVQLLANIIDFNQNPQLSLNEPRWQWVNDLDVMVEPHFSKQIIRQLTKRGHNIIIQPNTSMFGRAHLIFRLNNGVLVGAKEPRTDSYIACY
jgi:gamma-glutamyltranspeptidase/glutathione hydrolase